MTIGIGVVCSDGLVLGSDREVADGSVVTSQRKAHLLRHGNCSVALVGSDSMRLITLAAEEMQARLVTKPHWTIDGIRSEVLSAYEVLRKTYIDPNPRQHGLDLIVGMKVSDPEPPEMRLLSLAEGGIPNWIEYFGVIGIGHSIGKYLLDYLYDRRNKPSVVRAIGVVSYVLNEAKRNAPNVGRESDVIHMQWGLKSDFLSEMDLAEHKRISERFVAVTRPVMFSLGDINVSPPRLDKLIETLKGELLTIRSNAFIQQQAKRLGHHSDPLDQHVEIHGDEQSSNTTPVKKSPTIYTESETSVSPSHENDEPDDEKD